MQHLIFYNELYRIDNDLRKIMQDNPGVSFILNSKIKLFYQRAEVSINIMNKNIHRIQRTYIQVDDKDTLKKFEGDDDTLRKTPWLYKENVTVLEKELAGDDVEDAYLEELNFFMQTTTKIDY